MRSTHRLFVLSALAVLAPALCPAQTLVGRTDSVFTWRGSLGANGQLKVKNHNGPIDVRPSSGNQIELRAEKRTERGGGVVTDVAFEIQQQGGDVTICSVFRGNNPCDDWNNRDRDRDDDGWRRNVTVAMTLLVPKGAQVKVSTGNGAITVERVSNELTATTGNGRVRVSGTEGSVQVRTGNGDVEVREAKSDVKVSTGNGRITVGTVEGPVEARSGNGDIDVSMTKLSAREEMQFSTGSGNVRLTLPAGYNGELDATTGNGEVTSDFELKLQGRMDPRRVRATIGAGGPRLKLSTGNGRLEIRKGS